MRSNWFSPALLSLVALSSLMACSDDTPTNGPAEQGGGGEAGVSGQPQGGTGGQGTAGAGASGQAGKGGAGSAGTSGTGGVGGTSGMGGAKPVGGAGGKAGQGGNGTSGKAGQGGNGASGKGGQGAGGGVGGKGGQGGTMGSSLPLIGVCEEGAGAGGGTTSAGAAGSEPQGGATQAGAGGGAPAGGGGEGGESGAGQAGAATGGSAGASGASGSGGAGNDLPVVPFVDSPILAPYCRTKVTKDVVVELLRPAKGFSGWTSEAQKYLLPQGSEIYTTPGPGVTAYGARADGEVNWIMPDSEPFAQGVNLDDSCNNKVEYLVFFEQGQVFDNDQYSGAPCVVHAGEGLPETKGGSAASAVMDGKGLISRCGFKTGYASVLHLAVLLLEPGGPTCVPMSLGSGGSGQGGASAEVMAVSERICKITTSLSCPKDPTPEACAAEFASTPSTQLCLSEYTAWADCLEAQPKPDFSCGGDGETQLTTGACNASLSAVFDCAF